jgi:hypothetical protein
VDEVRYSNFTRTGVEVDSVSLDEAVRLYVNHRPVLGIGKAAIQDALGVIAARMEGGVADDGKISWRSVVEMLTGAGEVRGGLKLLLCAVSLSPPLLSCACQPASHPSSVPPPAVTLRSVAFPLLFWHCPVPGHEPRRGG